MCFVQDGSRIRNRWCQMTIQDLRLEIISMNSPADEPTCNGSRERHRKDARKVRVIRHQLEQGIDQQVLEYPESMTWMTRWETELSSKYAFGDITEFITNVFARRYVKYH